MPSSGRRSEELKKKLQRRNNSLKPADFAKEHILVDKIEKSKDRIEKSKAALSDLRKRIDERKKSSKLIDIQQYQEKREEIIPELTGTTSDDSPKSEREEPTSREETLAQTIIRSTQKQNQASMRGNLPANKSQQKVPSRSMKDHYRDKRRYRKEITEEAKSTPFNKAPPSHIEVRSKETPDDDATEVSEITTDVRIMSTKGASYAEHRMAGKIQMRLSKPCLSGPPGHHLEKDVNINVSDLRHLGKAVEKAKMDLRQEMPSTDAMSRRHGLPYDTTDYRASVDDNEEGDSWEDAIRACNQKPRNALDPDDGKIVFARGPPTPKKEHSKQITTNKASMGKLQKLVKEAYSYEGDVFIDATEVREEDLDGGVPVLADEGGDHRTPIAVDDTTVDTYMLFGDKTFPSLVEEEALTTPGLNMPSDEFIQQYQDETDGANLSTKRNKNESHDTKPIAFTKTRVQELSSIPSKKSNEKKCKNSVSVIDIVEDDVADHENVGRDDQSLDDFEKKPSITNNKTTSIASEFYNSSLGFFKSFSNQVDTQLKTFQQRGLISKSDMDGMLGVLEHDMEETNTKLPKDGDDAVILFGDQFETTACGTNMQVVDDNIGKENGSDADPVEKMLESLKKSYNSTITKCGVDCHMIKENTKAIEDMVANLKKAKTNYSESDQNNASVLSSKAQSESLPEEKIDENLLKKLSAQGVEEMLKTTIPSKSRKGENKVTAPESQTFIVPINMPNKESE